MLIREEVTSDSDFDELIALLWYSYSEPRIPMLPLLFPVDDDDPEGKEKAIQLSKGMFVKAHHADPTSHWFKVRDSETGRIVGGCRWHVNETSPYLKQAKAQQQVDAGTKAPFVAPTYDAGTAKEFASLVLGQVLNPRADRYTRPHTHLHICFVHPEYRRKGIGKMLAAWGVDRADEMGVESFLEATDMGKALYETFGFVVVSTEHANTDREHKSPEWEKLEQKFLPYSWHCMWRPIGGKFIEGETTLPW